GSPYSVASTGKFAYVPNLNDGTVTGYAVNAQTGALTVLAGSPFPAGSHPSSVGFDSSVAFAYVANFDDANLLGYSINSSTGALTELATPFAAGAGPNWVSMVPKLSVQIGNGESSPIPINTKSIGKAPVQIGPVVTWDLANSGLSVPAQLRANSPAAAA